ncbi:alpha-L-fucosidase [uncultured Paludibaculum sp.]|uniref:alpha-L-fucosidase n=1 Tax=uncultured Paludibaculum sp. TaxID=1765020 RepID=UPI002AAB4D5A|nr:alpha-L-fucosidase [uncultured Paludibaculum sp.]
MNRRAFLSTLTATAATLPAAFAQKYSPDWTSLKAHAVPTWFEDAKFGIFIHWGLYSVPAWAPPSGELGQVDMSKWFYQNAYAEWYLNSIRLKESDSYKHHVETYGVDFDYYRFGQMFEKQNRAWKPQSWAGLFKDCGARYVVLTTKHHDGYTLWPSKVPNPKRPQGGINSPRDLVGDLTKAVRGAGLRMGLYYSGGLDWTFEQRPIATMGDLRTTAPQTEEYARYADAHWRELIRLYQPAVLWNDIGYPKLGKPEALFADYYNAVPEGVINNRFSVDYCDFTTPEYAKYDKITPKKWESCRGLGFSFGYNQVEGAEHVIAPVALIELLVDIVSKNGNLLLNIGPKPDGSISEIQLNRLNALGAWLKANGEGVFGSRPWVRPSAKTAAGGEVRFTHKGPSLYAFLFGPQTGSATITGLSLPAGAKVRALGGGAVNWKKDGDNTAFELDASPRAAGPLTLSITPAPAA